MTDELVKRSQEGKLKGRGFIDILFKTGPLLFLVNTHLAQHLINILDKTQHY